MVEYLLFNMLIAILFIFLNSVNKFNFSDVHTFETKGFFTHSSDFMSSALNYKFKGVLNFICTFIAHCTSFWEKIFN